MAVEYLPSVAWSLTIPNTTTLVRASDIQYGVNARNVPDNCTSIIVYNTDGTNAIFVRFGDPALVTAPQMTLLNSTLVPALGSITFSVGVTGARTALTSNAELAVADLFLMAQAGAPVVNVTCIQGRPTANV